MDTRAIVGLIVGLIVMAFGAAVIVFISLKNENAATLLAIGYLMLILNEKRLFKRLPDLIS